jgi:hypothetical protein
MSLCDSLPVCESSGVNTKVPRFLYTSLKGQSLVDMSVCDSLPLCESGGINTKVHRFVHISEIESLIEVPVCNSSAH